MIIKIKEGYSHTVSNGLLLRIIATLNNDGIKTGIQTNRLNKQHTQYFETNKTLIGERGELKIKSKEGLYVKYTNGPD